MDIELENEIQKRLHKYHKKMWASYGTIAIDILFLIYMVIFKLDLDICSWSFGIFGTFLIYVAVFAAYAAIAVLACLLEAFGKLEIEKILFEECDPFLYEACAMRIKQPFFKDRVNCNLAVARYYQGNTDAAYDTLMAINPEKLKREFALNYYLLLSMIYFRETWDSKFRSWNRHVAENFLKIKKDRLFLHICVHAIISGGQWQIRTMMQRSDLCRMQRLHQIVFFISCIRLHTATMQRCCTEQQVKRQAPDGIWII